MPRIDRQETPPAFPQPAHFKFYLRRDFRYRCAYCTIHEAENQGHESFEAEHFRPESAFSHLRVAYENLYYACRLCNKWKGDCWPKPEQESQGLRFVDPCDEDPEEHWAELGNGELIHTTPTGLYTMRHIRLNRPQLVALRRARRRADERLLMELSALQGALDRITEALRAPGLDEWARQALLDQRESWSGRADRPWPIT